MTGLGGIIELPFPAKVLWPNGRTRNIRYRNAEFQKHKQWAYAAALEKLPRCFQHNGTPLRLHCTVHPKTRHAIDDDNAAAAMKAYQDGIALAMKVNDKLFGVPAIIFAEPIKGGRVTVEIAPCSAVMAA